MNVEAVGRAAVRILAIWLFVSSVSELSRVASIDSQVSGSGIVIGTMVGAIATYCVGAFALWRYAALVARRIAGDGWAAETTVAGVSAFAIGQVAVGVLGAFMLSQALPESLWLVVVFLVSKLMGPSPLGACQRF